LFVIEVSANLQSEKKVTGVTAIWNHQCAEKKNTGFKVKADLARNVSASIKNNIEGYGNYIFGVNVSDFGAGNQFSYGAQL
jgi:hypothetical protein